MFLILVVVMHSFPSVLYLIPSLEYETVVNGDHVDAFLQCNNQLNEGNLILGGLK